MDWKILNSEDQIQEIIALSKQKPVGIFKHSTRCSISSMAKMRLEDAWDFKPNEIDIYYLDLLAFRPISNKVAEVFEVHHQSPQLLLIRNGECTYEATHLDISVSELHEGVAEKI